MAVVISSTVTAVNDYQKEKQFRRLNDVANSQKEVLTLSVSFSHIFLRSTFGETPN